MNLMKGNSSKVKSLTNNANDEALIPLETYVIFIWQILRNLRNSIHYNLSLQLKGVLKITFLMKRRSEQEITSHGASLKVDAHYFAFLDVTIFQLSKNTNA